MTQPAADPAPSPSPSDPFARYEGRVLDPATAVRLPGGPAPTTTVYRGDTLLFTGRSRADVERLIAAVAELAAGLNLRVAGPDVFTEIETADGEVSRRPIAGSRDVLAHNKLARLLALAEQAGVPLVVPVRFESTLDGPAPAVDVWPLLHQGGQDAGRDSALVLAIGLDHLMFSAASISGNPFTRGMSAIMGNPFTRAWPP